MTRESRLVVGGVSGYAISPSFYTGYNHPFATVWGVRDSAYCYELVREFKRPAPLWVGGKYAGHLTAREQAERLAAKLNAEQ